MSMKIAYQVIQPMTNIILLTSIHNFLIIFKVELYFFILLENKLILIKIYQ